MHIETKIMNINPVKNTLADLVTGIRLSHRKLAAECNVSPATINLIVKHNIWPKSAELTDQLRNDIKQILLSAGCPEAEIDRALKIEEHTMGMNPLTLRHFGWHNNPFSASRVKGPRDVLDLDEHKNAVDRICEAGINSELLILIGPQGTGKTTAIDAAEYRLNNEPNKACRVVRILQPEIENLKIGPIIDSIGRAISCNYQGYDQGRKIEEILSIQSQKNAKRLLAVIDDGHALHPKTLLAIKRFWDNTKIDFGHLLGIVILAQEGIETSLSRSDLVEVATHADIIEIWGLLNEAELRDYIALKLKPFFNIDNPKAYDHIDKLMDVDIPTLIWQHEQSKAVKNDVIPVEPRHLNTIMIGIANRAAFLGDPKITADHINYVYTSA